MYKATIGRSAIMHGAKVNKQMGVNTWAAFAGTDENALVDGDFAMTKEELQGVLKRLRAAGINIVAIHNHMTNEEPQYVFLHYMGKGPAAKLARGLRAALDSQSVRAKADTVLFVCEHGAAKSVIAAAEFNRLAEQRGIATRAIFRGTNPDAEIAPAVAEALEKDGMPVHGKPSKVTRGEIDSSSEVVTLGCRLPEGMTSGSLHEWNDTPSFGASPDAARQYIRTQVTKLMDEMTRNGK